MSHTKIQAEYDEMLEGLAELNSLQRVANNAFKREFSVIDSYYEDNQVDKIISRDAFGFKNPFTGKTEKYAFKNITIDDLRKTTIWHKNNQYCWLLMSAYEKFEIFLKNSFLILKNDGETRNIQPIRLYFTDTYPEFKKSEARNKFGIHLRVAVTLVEKMRHVIAHQQCNVPDIKEFVKRVIDDSGINNDKSDHEEFVSQFIVENKVFILETPANNDKLLPVHHDLYTNLVSYLISYAYLVLRES